MANSPANSPKAPDNKGQSQGSISSAGQSVQEAAPDLTQKARETAGDLGHRAKELAGAAAERTDDALGAVGQGMSSLAGTIRQNVPHEGVLGSAAGSVAEGLDTGGKYLREHGLNEIGDDVGRLVRQHPLPALLTVFGIGFLLGSALRR